MLRIYCFVDLLNPATLNFALLLITTWSCPKMSHACWQLSKTWLFGSPVQKGKKVTLLSSNISLFTERIYPREVWSLQTRIVINKDQHNYL